jgi:drug/metabolite transporter (DMT)-like permease
MIEIKNGSRIGKTDALMLLTVLLWAVNLSVIKVGLRELSAHGFNAIRLSIASVVYLVLLAASGKGFRLEKGDHWKAVGLGVLGITAYQLFFIQAIRMTQASAASVIMATSPVFIALLSTALGQERIPWAGWIGIFVSFAGFVLVVSGENGAFSLSWHGHRAAALILLANVCWAGYTVFAKPALERNSPFRLAARSTAAGTFLYLPFAARDLAAVPWARISWQGWAALLYAGLVSIVLCFVIWYDSVQKVGSSKTGIYSNLTPIFAVVFAGVFLHERLSGFQAAGAVIVLAGVYLTRSGYRFFERRPREDAAAEEVDICGPNS